MNVRFGRSKCANDKHEDMKIPSCPYRKYCLLSTISSLTACTVLLVDYDDR